MGGSDLGGEGGVEFWRAEAQRLAADNVALRARVAELEGQVGALAEKVSVLARMAFGTSSEKAARPAPGGAGATGGAGGDDPGGGPEKRGRGQRRGGRGHGRRDYSHLPTREEIHDVPEAERVCPRCGAGYARFGQECCEQIDWQVQLTRIVHRRPTYRRTCRCPVRGVLVALRCPRRSARAGSPRGSWPGCWWRSSCWAVPRTGSSPRWPTTGSMSPRAPWPGCSRRARTCWAPLAALITERNTAAAHLHIDETSWKVYAAVEGKDSHRWWCWVFVGPDTTVFRIAPSRSLKVLTDQLGIQVDPDTGALPDALPEGRQVLLSSDFYTVYQALGRLDGVDNLWCWSHIRRYFIRAGDAHPELATWTAGWVERIAELYVAHTAMGAAEPGGPAHTWAAAQFSAALNTIDAERTAQMSHAALLHPAAAKVLATLDREWDGLARHREFPELALDNNTSERALRGPVVGRKNYYGSGSVISAQLAGRAWTITATAERAGLNPLTYLQAYLDQCAQAGNRAPTGQALTRFLPWAAGTDDLTAWARDPRPHPDHAEPDPTGSDLRCPTHDLHTGPAP